MLHLHPLRSRVKDMEHKIKVAMDNLIRAVKMAASTHPLPCTSSYLLIFALLTHSLHLSPLLPPPSFPPPPPSRSLTLIDFSPDMLLCCHHLTVATSDFLMVAQCASLTHRVVIHGWDLMQLPWVKVNAGSGLCTCRSSVHVLPYITKILRDLMEQSL